MGDVPEEYDNGDNAYEEYIQQPQDTDYIQDGDQVYEEYIPQDSEYIPDGDQLVTEEYIDAPIDYIDGPYEQDDEEYYVEVDQRPTTEFDVNDDFDAALGEDYKDGYPEPEEIYEDANYSYPQGEEHKVDSRGSSPAGSNERKSRSGSEPESGSKAAFDYDNDDADWDKVSDEEKPWSPTVYIAKLVIKNWAEAAKYANIIIELLEEDVANYLEKKGIVPNSENYDEYGMQKPIHRTVSGSVMSISSYVSVPGIGDPSTMHLFYEKGENALQDTTIPNLQSKMAVSENVEANLHRKRHGKIKTADSETQTKNMALVTSAKAEMVYWTMYPKPDDWKPPMIPSRQPSMQLAVDKAAESDQNVDKATIKPQIKRSIKKRILKPLPEDYYKDETFWTGSRFRGEYKNRQLHLGHFDFATGTTYESEFKNGHSHSRNHTGLLVYPRGDTYEGQWRKGRYQAGEIVFADGLKYEPRDWNYCIPPDRRFKSEKILGIHAAGNTIYNDRFPPMEQQKLPPGCFDVGEGIYDPKTGTVTGYDGAYLRDITSYEHRWILANCRKAKYPREVYVPKFSEERLPGSSCEKRPCNR